MKKVFLIFILVFVNWELAFGIDFFHYSSPFKFEKYCIFNCLAQAPFLMPSAELERKFLASSDNVKLEIFRKLWVLENSNLENGLFKISIPDIAAVTLLDGSIIYDSRKSEPIKLKIGTEQYNLEYEIVNNQKLTIAVREDSRLLTEILLGVGVGSAGIILGYIIGGALK